MNMNIPFQEMHPLTLRCCPQEISMILYMDQVEIPNYERRFVTTITLLQYIDISILIYENKHILIVVFNIGVKYSSARYTAQ